MTNQLLLAVIPPIAPPPLPDFLRLLEIKVEEIPVEMPCWLHAHSLIPENTRAL